MTDSERFAQWLNGTTSTAATMPKTTRKRKPKQYGLLIEQANFAPSCTDGKRRGFNGTQPRTSAPEHTSDVTVTLASGDVYTVKKGSRSRRKATTDTVARDLQAETDKANRMERHHKVTAGQLAPIGNNEG